MAAAGKHAALVQRLLDAGAAATAVSTGGGTVLHWLAKAHLSAAPPAAAGLEPCSPPPVVPQALQEVVQLLLSNGIDVNATDQSGATALNIAAQRNTAAVAVLLEFGANVDAANNKGLTPFHVAVVNKHVAAARLLLEAGADWNLNVIDRLPYEVAVARGDAAMVRLLVHFGADPNLLVVGGRRILCMAVVAGYEGVVQALLDVGAETCNTLVVAALHSQLPVVKVLLQHRGSQPSLNTVFTALLASLRRQQQDADGLRIFATLLLHLWCYSSLAGAVRLLAHPRFSEGQARSVLTSALLSSWAEMDAADSTLASQEQHLASVKTAAQHLYLQMAAAQRTTSSDVRQAATATAAELAGAAQHAVQ